MLIIDRIEGEFAVCETEDGEKRDLPASLLADGAREGDVLDERDGGYRINFEETERRRAGNAGRLSRLLRREGRE